MGQVLARGRSQSRMIQGRRRRTPKIVILGLQGAGKTTIIYRLRNKTVPPITQFRSMNVKTIKRGDGKVTILETDVPNYRQHKKWTEHLADCQGLIWVTDSHDRVKIANSGNFLKVAMNHVGNVPLLVLANKSDILAAADITEVYANLDLQLGKDYVYNVCACCATTGEGLEAALAWLISKVMDRE